MIDYTSDHLQLSYIAPAQAQKHVTANESFAVLDAVCQGAVLEIGRNTPPGSPGPGARYVIGASPTGAWAGQAGRFTIFRNQGWHFLTPKPGWRLYNLADDRLYGLTGAGQWAQLTGSGGGAIGEVQNASRIGLGMAADAANPLAARLNAALFTAVPAGEGGTGSVILACNKTAVAADAGFALQRNFVTRAVAGLFGSDRFRIGVSPDGTTFHDALSVDPATGIVDQPRLTRFKAHTNFDNFAPANTWVKIGINTAEANDQGAFSAATSQFTAPVEGLYLLGASLLFKQDTSANARMRARLIRNGAAEIPGSFGEISGAHVSLATALWLQTCTPLAPGDTVELQGHFRAADGYFAATHTAFWGFKVG